MKFLLSLSFLLFAAASSINASSFIAEGSTAPDGPPVLDTNDAPLQFGVPYYMLYANNPRSISQGVSLEDATPSQPCPKLIKVRPDVTDRGTPVVFSSEVQNVTGNITVESPLIINFYNLTRPNDESCGGSNSTAWVLTETKNLEIYDSEKGGFPFKLNQYPLLAHTYMATAFGFKHFPVLLGVDNDGYLVVSKRGQTHMLVVFQEAKSTEEDEDDKPVIIQMPRKMSV